MRQIAAIVRWRPPALTTGSTSFRPFPRALGALANLRRRVLAEIFDFEDLTDLDYLTAIERRVREALDDLFLRLARNESEARDQLLRFGERAVGNGRAPAVEAQPCSLGRWLEAFAGQQHAVFCQLLVEGSHLGELLARRKHTRLAIVVCLDQNRESH
jgi:hypothetical protein